MSDRRKIYLSVMGIAAAVLLALLLLQMRHAGGTWLAGSQFGSLSRQLEELDARLAAAPDPAELREQILRETAEIEAESALAAAIVPELVDPAAIGPTLTDWARAAGVQVDDFTPGQSEAVDGGLEALLMTVRLRGGYDEVAGFVSAVEGLDHPSGENPRHIEVESITATPQPDTADPEWTLALRTYAFRGGDVDEHSDAAESGESLEDLASARRFDYEPGERDIMAPPAAPVGTVADAPPSAPATQPDTDEPALATQPSEREAALQSGLAEMANAIAEGRYDDAVAVADIALKAAGASASASESDLLDRMSQHRDELVRRHGSTADAAAFAALGVNVEGISWSPADPRAVVNGGILAVGDTVLGNPEVRVAAIDKATVTFDYDGGEHIVGVKMYARP
ncbi:MAG: type 4a pilus biogenesis protein PilO [Planctomycetaceae bacterium]|nr:type 4a pilus biogenesis protein PilO [Planctomycetaceae bacterium]